MKAALLVLALVTASASFLLFQRISTVKSIEGSAVIAEKVDGIVGGQVIKALPRNLSERQVRLLQKAYSIARENGHRNPEIVQAVLLQETLAGGLKSYRVANPGREAYFGPMQLKLVAAKDVLARWPELYNKYDMHTRTDDEIRAFLILNDRFNIEVGSLYLLLLQRQYGFKGRELLNAYNRGPGGVRSVDDTFHYAIGAERKLASYRLPR
jgi:hypothetical protein